MSTQPPDVDYVPKQRHFLRSDSIAALAGALAKAQGEIKGAEKAADNPFFGKKYADLDSIWDACRGPLSKNGLAVMQFPRVVDDGIEVETILVHESGEWVSETLGLPVSKHDAQGIGSAITYGRRYSLAPMVGVAPEEDDGNAAAAAAPYPKQKKQDTPADEPRLSETQWNTIKALLTPDGQKALLKHFKVAGPRAMLARQFDDAMLVCHANKSWLKPTETAPASNIDKPMTAAQKNEIDTVAEQFALTPDDADALAVELFGAGTDFTKLTEAQADRFIGAMRAKLGEGVTS